MDLDEVKITKKEIWLEVKTLVVESQRATRLALFVLGFAICGVAIPSLIKLLNYSLLSEVIFVILYLGFGMGMMVSEGLRLKKLKQKLEKLKA